MTLFTRGGTLRRKHGDRLLKLKQLEQKAITANYCFQLCIFLILPPISYFIIEFFHEYISLGARQASGV